MDIIIIGLLAILGMGALVGIATLLNRQKAKKM